MTAVGGGHVDIYALGSMVRFSASGLLGGGCPTSEDPG